MDNVLSYNNSKIERVSPTDDKMQYFYGYYDNQAMTKDDTMHLCNRVKFMDRLPVATDENELGWFDLCTKEFHVFAKTTAWNFQQGCMLQWLDSDKREVMYNIWNGTKYEAVAQNILTQETRHFGEPLANISPDGKWGLSINFNRVYDFRAGYGYCNRKDLRYDTAVPDDDGITLVNLKTGECKLIITYETMQNIFADTQELYGRKIVVNHITFNPTSNRFLFLVRYFPQEGGQWQTALGTSDLEGNVYKLRGYIYASHYFWRDENTLLIYADGADGAGLYELTDLTQDYKRYSPEFFHEDIHCSYSPNREFIIGDGYADEQQYRPLYLYHIKSGRGMLLARFYSPPLPNFDIRSDLHCRWTHGGTQITFDSIHEGFRALYTMDLSDALVSLINNTTQKER